LGSGVIFMPGFVKICHLVQGNGGHGGSNVMITRPRLFIFIE